MRAFIQVKGVEFYDGEYGIAIQNIATRQSSIPPLAFDSVEAAQDVVNAICEANPNLYTNQYPDEWKEQD